ncbi:hypothetical protein [Albidovulum sediminis]|uniref:Uncharacterized protein n=1 Tax=Albidovulum sediminis TaxID=3066345 RepID=A0ABT2NQN9_9RHOB|nr:hypothetical protein [Defluviimonas sediminis]MCT8331020.1 hypothetical protein [Defluviimonas sediminis]
MPNQKTDPDRIKAADPSAHYPAEDDRRLAAGDVIAFGLSLLWLAVFGGLFWYSGTSEGGAAQVAVILIAIGLPVALIWFAALTLRATRAIRDEARQLRHMMDAMRQTYAAQAEAGSAQKVVEKRLDEIAAAARKTEQTMAMFVSVRDGAATQPPPDRASVLIVPSKGNDGSEQPDLALGTPPEAAATTLSVADRIRALNFPDGPDDRDGFRALRQALQDRHMAKIIRAAQDVLTLLSQDGIYMDDLTPERARPELWRRFAQGERGRPLAALGGIRDRSSLALSAARMRQDTIFRDAAHHFLRQFDRTLAEIEQTATDAEIAALSETRTARAFMLLGRVSGVFD